MPNERAHSEHDCEPTTGDEFPDVASCVCDCVADSVGSLVVSGPLTAASCFKERLLRTWSGRS